MPVEGGVPCELCNKTFENQNAASRHKLLIHYLILPRDRMPVEGGVPCELCNKTFVHQNAASRHKLHIHPTLSPKPSGAKRQRSVICKDVRLKAALCDVTQKVFCPAFQRATGCGVLVKYQTHAADPGIPCANDLCKMWLTGLWLLCVKGGRNQKSSKKYCVNCAMRMLKWTKASVIHTVIPTNIWNQLEAGDAKYIRNPNRKVQVQCVENIEQMTRAPHNVQGMGVADQTKLNATPITLPTPLLHSAPPL
jgi:hypothetical protein